MYAIGVNLVDYVPDATPFAANDGTPGSSLNIFTDQISIADFHIPGFHALVPEGFSIYEHPAFDFFYREDYLRVDLELTGHYGFDIIKTGTGDDTLISAPEDPNLDGDGHLMRDEHGDYIYGGEDVLSGGLGYDRYVINSSIDFHSVIVPGGYELKKLWLPTTTVIEDEGGQGKITWNGQDITHATQKLKVDWRSEKYELSAEMVGNDLHILLPPALVLQDETNVYGPLNEWQYSSFYGSNVPPEFSGIGANRIVIRNYEEGALGFYFNGGLGGAGGQGGNVAGAAMTTGFGPNDLYGKAYDNFDGTASFNANIEDVEFTYDGRDLWVLIAGSQYDPVHVWGVFDGANYVRPGATTLTAFHFLDGSLLLSDVATAVASDLAATVGTAGNEVLAGRAGLADIFHGGAGTDTYVIDANSGSDMIRRDGETQAERDLIQIDYRSDRVFERTQPGPEVGEYDQVIEFIDERMDEFGNLRLYLSEQTVIVEHRYWDPVLDSLSYTAVEKFDYTYTDVSGTVTWVPRLKLAELPFLRSEVTLSRSAGGEAGYDDLIVDYRGISYTVLDQFLEVPDDFRPTFEDFDLLVFADGEVLTRDFLAAATPLVMNENDTWARGTSYSETVIGSDASDTIDGAPGDDVLIGGAGDDSLFGDTPDDFYSEYTGHGDDNLSGGIGNDMLAGGGGDDDLDGGGDSDMLDGGLGDDMLAGSGGDDTLIGWSGADTLDGGEGIDTASYAGSDAGVTVSLFAGAPSGGHAQGDTLVFVENLAGSGFDDALTGSDDVNTLTGGLGNDQLSGRDGDDVIHGNEGADTLNGGSGADQLFGGGGNDTVAGGAGNDVVFGGGNDDFIKGDSGNDTLHGEGQSDILQGFVGDDALHGGIGNDELNGGDGADMLYGGDNADTLAGAAGDDLLDGGSGNDSLTGGTGADILVFADGYQQDQAGGFEDDIDTIRLDDALWGGGKTAAQVLADHATQTSPGVVTFDFGGGDILKIVNGAGISAAALENDIVII